jgi:hypothetical protein
MSTWASIGWKPGVGERSLATICASSLMIMPDDKNRPRIRLEDGSSAVWTGLPFQDASVKQHETECAACEGSRFIRNLKNEFDANRTLIRVGLTRPFSPADGTEPMCWLQVTNILAKPRTHFTNIPPRCAMPKELASAR